jgi:RHS repeat-associated protein
MRASPTVQLFYCRNAKNQYDTTGADANCPPQTQLESFSHDEDGNLTADGVLTYEWDAENRLISVYPTTPTTGSKLLEFTYDYMGRRVRKLTIGRDAGNTRWLEEPTDTPETDQRFVYDGWTLDTPLRASPGHRGAMGPAGPDAASQGWNVILVLDGNADANEDGQPDILRKYTWGLDLSGQSGNHSSPAGIHGAGGIGGLLSVKETQGTTSTADDVNYWFMHDANGNVSQIVEDGTWALVAHYEYDPYGNVVNSPASQDVDSSGYAFVNPFRFSTKWLDDESGLYYYGYRYYSSRLGRWVSWDPIGERGGLNLIGFVENSPANGIDLIGLWKINRDGGEQAFATAEQDDTVQKLADLIGLEASEYHNWLEQVKFAGRPAGSPWPSSQIQALPRCSAYWIPNTVLAYWGGELGGFGEWWVRWHEDVGVLSKRGFKVDENTNWTARQFENYILNETTHKKLHGLFFWGHGSGYWVIDKPAPPWDLLKTLEKKHMVWTGIVTDSAHKKNANYHSSYSSWTAVYRMALGVLWACGTDAAKDPMYRIFSGSPGAKFRGAPGVLWPHGFHLYGEPMDKIIIPGEQGTRQ